MLILMRLSIICIIIWLELVCELHDLLFKLISSAVELFLSENCEFKHVGKVI